jgi:hypothetical protein
MVINDRNVVCTAIAPFEYNSPLVVDANAVLARSLPPQGLQAISGWNFQILERGRCVEQSEFPERGLMNTWVNASWPLAPKKGLGFRIGKRDDHAIHNNQIGY